MRGAIVLGASALAVLVIASSRASSSSSSPRRGVSMFGAHVAARAARDLGVNGGDRVAQMLANFGNAPPADWCAAALGTWVREEAAAEGLGAPIKGSAGAKATGAQFREASNPRVGWLDVLELRAAPELLAVGLVPVWHRGAPGAWTGHIGVIDSVGTGGAFTAIEGNATGGAVARGSHDLSSANLLGAGFFVDEALTRLVVA